MSTNQITVVGNLTRKPELRRTPSGHSVLDLTVAENHRRRDQNTGEWRDVSRNYYTVTCWRKLAVSVAQTLDKGHPVIVVGRLYLDEWVDRDGVLRRTPKIDPISVGFDLRYGPVLALPRASAELERAAGDGPRRRGAEETPDDEPEMPPVEEEPADDEALYEVGARPGSER